MSSIVKVDTIQENTSANGITVDGLNIKDSKLVTANSVVQTNITDGIINNAKTNFVSTSSAAGLQIKGDGTTDGTLQLNCSQNSHGIKLKSPAHSAGASYTLTFPVNDGDANQVLTTNGSGVLSFTTPASAANTPQFSARASSNQTIANSTLTKVVFGTEVFDPQNTFASSKFTPAVAGNYFMTTSIRFANGGTYIPTIQVRLNGTNIYWVGGTKAASAQYMNVSFSFAITMDDNDYVEIFAQQDSGGNLDIHGGSDVGTVFNGFKIT